MPQWTPEEARAFAAKGGQAKAERAALKASTKSPEERARAILASKSPTLARELLKAAAGEGDYSELSPKDRLAAVKAALDWGMGKATSAPKQEPSKGDAPPTGLSIE